MIVIIERTLVHDSAILEDFKQNISAKICHAICILVD